MQKFGTFTPSGLSRLILILAKLGFGRGRLKRIFAQLWKNIYGINPVDFEYYGLNFRLQPNQNTIESKMLFGTKRREKEELAMIARFLPPRGIFVDIGANIGYYAINAAHLGAEKVIAIEPNPLMLARMADNIALNDLSTKIVTHGVAVGANKGSANLIISDNDLGSSSIVNTSVGSNQISVGVTPLLEVLKQESVLLVDVIKIDIEGMEDRALFPYFEAISPKHYPKLIVMEDGINAHWERNILEWLLENGYQKAGRTRGNVMLTLNQ